MEGQEEKWYSVSEAVQETGVPSHVLRYWEEELQVEIRRTEQGHRMYSGRDVELFRRVKELKENGIQLKAIRVLLAALEAEPKAGARDGLAEQILEIERCQAAGQAGSERAASGQNAMETPMQGQSVSGYEGDCREDSILDHGVTEYEIVVDEKAENLRRFEAILKRMMEEVAQEQNEKLLASLTDAVRDGIEELCQEYLGDGAREAALSGTGRKKREGGLLHSLRRYFGRR